MDQSEFPLLSTWYLSAKLLCELNWVDIKYHYKTIWDITVVIKNKSFYDCCAQLQLQPPHELLMLEMLEFTIHTENFCVPKFETSEDLSP